MPIIIGQYARMKKRRKAQKTGVPRGKANDLRCPAWWGRKDIVFLL